MPENVMEATYCSQQIVIPPSFPHILKVFAKAAIRTQPYDLLTWAAAYFKALADGTVPPMKERLEYPLIRSEGGLSYGYLKLLVKQFDTPEKIEKKILTKRWIGICLSEVELKQILCTAGVYRSPAFPLHQFIAVAAGFLCNNLTQTMVMLCEIYTDEPDGSNASISAEFFIELYKYLANIDASQQVVFYDGLTKEEYKAKLRKGSLIMEEDEEEREEEPSVPQKWVFQLRGWRTQSAVLKRNVILGEEMPLEGGKISENIRLPFRAPRERFTDPNHPHFPTIPPEELECHFGSEDDISSQSILPSKRTTNMNISMLQVRGDNDTQDSEEKTDDDSPKDDPHNDSNNTEEGEHVDQDNSEAEPPSDNGEENAGEDEEKPQEDDANNDDEPEESAEKGEGEETEDGEEKTGEEGETGQATEGSNVLVRVFSEEGKKIRSLSLVSNEEPQVGEGSRTGTEDISVKEREAIIEQLEINKEKRLSEFIETIESLDNLVEKTKKLKSKADKIGGKDLVVCSASIMGSTSAIMTSDTSPKEKSLSESTQSSKIAQEHLPDVVVVPSKPGIGPIVDTEMVEEVIKFIEETASYQAGQIMPRDILHCLSPPLEKKVPVDSV